MTLLQQLHETSAVAHDLLVLSIVILSGIGLGNIRVSGVKLGVAGVLFTGLAAAHFGMHPAAEVTHFLKDFGLVLFVFALGMQMGPGFFASLRQQGRVLNGYAFALVMGGALVAVLGGWMLGMPPRRSQAFCRSHHEHPRARRGPAGAAFRPCGPRARHPARVVLCGDVSAGHRGHHFLPHPAARVFQSRCDR
jgi:hypothetical protein